MRRTLSTLASLALIAVVAVALPTSPATASGVQQPIVVSANPANGTPHVLDGIVNAIVPVGNQIIVGGSFTQVRAPGGATLGRTNIFAFDATTFAINQNFAPVLDGDVLALATDGTSVFVGGTFQNVDGVKNNRLVKLNAATGAAQSWGVNINSGSGVYDMVVRGGLLYIGGAFSTVNGEVRHRLAAINVTTGALSSSLDIPFEGKHNGGTQRVHKIDVSPDGTRLVAIGNFLTAGGLDRRQIAMIDLSTNPATVANWYTTRFEPQCTSRFDTYMRDVDFAPNGSYFVIGTTGAWRGGPGAGVLCDTVTRWTPSQSGVALQPDWADYTGGDTTFSVAATGTAVYVGGHQRWWNNPFVGDRVGPGAVSRMGIAALDPLNGLPFQWDPVRDPRGLGVMALVPTSAGLWVGSDTGTIGGEYHDKVAFMPLAGGSSVPVHVNPDLPNDIFTVPQSGSSIIHRSFTGTTFGSNASLATSTDWSTARGVFFSNNRLYAGWSDGTFTWQSFDGTSVGAKQSIGLNGLTNGYWPVSSITGMTLENGRLYYTRSGDARLYYRYFTLESGVVGAETFTASGNGDGFNWSDVSGMTLASGRLYFSRTNGNLYSVNWANGRPQGSITTISGPATGDGRTWQSRGLFVWGANPDQAAPTVPGTPSGVATSSTTIDLTWAASSDTVSQVLDYRVYRDGGANPIATVSSGSGGTVSFQDAGLAPGSGHTYQIDAVDAAGNASAKSAASATIATLSVFWADGFDSGDFSAWTKVTRLTIASGSGFTAPPSAAANTSNQNAYARQTLDATYASLCASTAVNVTSQGTAALDLLGLRTAGNGRIAKVLLSSSGNLQFKSEVASQTRGAGTTLGSGWHAIEICGTVGAGTTWDLYLDGVLVIDAWSTNTGSTPVGRVQIGSNVRRSYSAAFDDVVVDGSPG